MTSVLEGRMRGLGRLAARLGPQATSLRGLLGWWARALAAWLPLRVRRVLGIDRGRLLLSPVAGEARLQLLRDGALHDAGLLPVLSGEVAGDPLAGVIAPAVADLPRWLVLSPGDCLVRRLALPAAAADRLRDVVRFEIDRQTPFAAEDVLFDARLLGRRAADGQLDVELVVAPRSRVEPQLAALGAFATGLAGIDALGPEGLPRGVNLLDPAQRGRLADPWRTWNRILVAVALVAIAAALWTVLDNRRRVADALDDAVRDRARPARMAAQQRAALVALVQGQAFLDQRRAERPTSVQVLDELSRRLPDGTYLEKVALENDRLTVIGLSNEASSLVSRLEGSPVWHSPALAGALQPDPATNRDRFTLTAELGPAPAAGATR